MNALAERAGFFLALLDLEVEIEALRLAIESGDARAIREVANRLVLMIVAIGYVRMEHEAPYLLERVGVRVLEANCALAGL